MAQIGFTQDGRLKKGYVAVVTVVGRMDFPLDMLRYDRATPDTESDSARIAGSFRPLRQSDDEPREVRVQMDRMPTTRRWASFGWTVRDVQARYVG